MLPGGVKGLETEDYFFDVGKNKIVMGDKRDPSTHITLSFGSKSGRMDIHRKDQSNGTYETLWVVGHEELMSEAKSAMSHSSDLIQVARLGWFHHKDISIAFDLTDSALGQCRKKRKRRIVIDSDFVADAVRMPIYMEEIFDFPDQNFLLLRRGTIYGAGRAHITSDGKQRIRWIRVKHLQNIYERIIHGVGTTPFTAGSK